MQLPSILSNLNFSQISGYLGNSNYILPLVSLFLVRFVLGGIFRSGLGLLVILAAVFLIVSSDPQLSSQLAGFAGFGDAGVSSPLLPFAENPWLLGAVFLMILFLFRGLRFSPVTLLLFVLVGYILFFRDFRPASLMSDGNWKTSLAGAAILLLVIFIYRMRTRRFYGQQPLNLNWLQPLLLGLALSFAVLIIRNPVWLEVQLPGWKNSIGLGVLASSCVAFFYNLPIKFRPYAISACWLFVIVTVFNAVGF